MPVHHPEILDARTTPPRLRVAALFVIGFLILLDFAGFHMAMTQLAWVKPSVLEERIPGLLYFGKWRMFTDTRPTHLVVEGEGQVGSTWTPIDLAELYPSRWVEGPGYERGSFRRDRSRMEMLATHICERTTTPFERVRLSEVTWPKTRGSVEQPRNDARSIVLVDVRCHK